MKSKKLIPLIAIGVLLASCGGDNVWSWDKASSDGELNYALLIGQIDHNDSAARTAGIRDALGTRGTKATNPNTESPKEGTLKLGSKDFKVTELEHGEQKNTSGATWDQQTATSTAEAWINKHGEKLDFFVSNNDGMAEGAIGASNWLKGTPIFGYDSNESTLQLIKSGDVMGTINQNASGQAASIYMVVRNILDGATPADAVKKGFGSTNATDYGYVSTVPTYSDNDHSFLVDNFPITAKNIDEYVGKTPAQLVDTNVKAKAGVTKNKVWHNFYSNSDTFLNSTMKPLFTEYAKLLNLDVDTSVSGDGNSESSVMNGLETALDKKEAEAYVINMVKTTATSSYLDKIATAYGATTADPTDIPVVFWNRQGTNEDGTVDTASMKDARFKHIYYVGFDAIQGGEMQGQMIVDYFKDLAK